MRWAALVILASLLVTLSAAAGDSAQHGTTKDAEEKEAPSVPASVKCFGELEQKMTSEQTKHEEFLDEANVATAKLKHASAVKKIALQRMKDLEGDVAREKATRDEAKAGYKKMHLAALNVYELARVALNRYNDLKKHASMDDTRSQEAMAAYLRYKELVLKVKAAAESAGEDPEANADFKQYTQMSSQYLTKYQGLQKAIKRSLVKADEEMKKYKTLSAKYKKAGTELKVADAGVIKAAAAYNAVYDKFNLQKAKYDHASEQTEAASKEYDAQYAKAMEHKEKWQAFKAEVARVAQKWNVFNEKVKRYGAQKAKLIEKQATYRSMVFKFTQGSKEHTQQAEQHLEHMLNYKGKYDAAHEAQHVFSEAYKNGGCGLLPHQIAALKAKAAARAKLKQDVAQAVQVADEELEAAQEMRDDAQLGKTQGKATDTSSTKLLREGNAIEAPAPSIAAPTTLTALPKPMKLETGGLSALPKPMKLETGGVVQDPVSLVQISLQGTDQKKPKKGECDYDREVATANFNAAEEAKMIMERHSKDEKKHRKVSGQMRSGATSAKNVLVSIKLKSTQAKRNEEHARKLRSEPCGSLSAGEEWDGEASGAKTAKAKNAETNNVEDATKKEGKPGR